MIERAGFWRRGIAALVDILVVQLLLQLGVGLLFDATGGRVTTNLPFYTACRPAGAEPAGWAPPAGRATASRSLCVSSLFGLPTRALFVAKHDGKPGAPAETTSVPVSPDGARVVRAVTLDVLFWPLFVLLRWLMDRSAGGSPGRRLTRIAVTDQGGTASGRALRPLLARRYARFAWPYGPGTAMLLLSAAWGLAAGAVPLAVAVLTWLASSALVGAAHLAAGMAIFRRQDAFYDGPSGTAVAPRLEIARAADMRPGATVAAVPGPWPDLARSGRAVAASMPWMSLGLAAVLGLVFLGELALPWTPAGASGVSVDTMMAWGGMDRQLVVAAHQPYRLLASIALHGNLTHLVVNAAALLVAGFLLERLLGRALFLGVFLAGGLGGSVASVAFNPLQQISIGASGGVLALFAAMLGLSAALPAGDARRWRIAWAVTVCLPSLLPVVPLPDGLTVDRADHLGGELAGLGLGVAIAALWRRGPRKPSHRAALAAGAGLAAVVAASVLAGGFRAPIQSSAMMPSALLPPDDDAGARDGAALAARYPEDPRALMFRAEADVLARHPDEAARDVERALAAAERLNPSGTAAFGYAAHVQLGGRFMQAGDLDGAIAQYTAALKYRTDDVVAFRQRGIAEFYDGRAEAALTDLDAAVRLTPIDPYAALWDHIVAVRDWRSDRRSVLQVALDGPRWPAPVLKFFLDAIDADALGAAAADPDATVAGEHLCEADFYRGERRAMTGDGAGARPTLQKAAAECPHSFIESLAALSELAGRGATPAR